MASVDKTWQKKTARGSSVYGNVIL